MKGHRRSQGCTPRAEKIFFSGPNWQGKFVSATPGRAKSPNFLRKIKIWTVGVVLSVVVAPVLRVTTKRGRQLFLGGQKSALPEKILATPMGKRDAYPEELLGGAIVDRSVLDLGLLSEIVGGFDRRLHAFDGEEGGEVGCVRRDDDESEEPPHAADDPTRHRPAYSSPHWNISDGGFREGDGWACPQLTTNNGYYGPQTYTHIGLFYTASVYRNRSPMVTVNSNRY